MSILFNPKTYDPKFYDDKTKALLKATIEFFEQKGKRKLKEDDRNRVWYDDFLFDQGRARGLSKIRFQDFAPSFTAWDTPNVKVFVEQIEAFKMFLIGSPPDKAQQKDVDFLLATGEIFTLIVYGQLILERAKIENLSSDEVDQIFDFMVRDLSAFALDIHGKASTTDAQAKAAMAMIMRPAVDNDRYTRMWTDHVFAEKDAYEMNA